MPLGGARPIVRDVEDAELDAIAEVVDLRGLRVLELGCGRGRFTRRYAHRACSVLAVDPNADAIRIAREELPTRLRRRVRFEALDAADVDVPPASFDLALFSWSL